MTKLRPGLLIFGLALALRLAWVLTLRNSLAWPDEFDFAAIARGLANGEGYVSESFRANPILPFYLNLVFRVVGEQYTIARIGQAILGALTCVLVYRTAALLLGQAVGVLAGIALALYLPQIFVAGVFYVDAFLTFFCALSVYLAVLAVRDDGVRLRLAAACGVALGLTILARPVFAVCVPAIGLAWLCRTRVAWSGRLAACVVLVATTAVPVVPWIVRDYAVHGRVLPISSGFFTKLWQGNSELSVGDADDRELMWNTDVWRRRLATLDPAEASAVEARYAAADVRVRELQAVTHDRYLATDQVLRPIVLDYMRAHPARVASLFWKKLVTLYSAYTPTMVHNEFTSERNQWLAALSFYPVLVLALLGMAIGFREWRRLGALYGVVLAVSAAYCLLNTCMRFRLPLDPYLIVFASLGAIGIWRAWLTARVGEEVRLEVFEEKEPVRRFPGAAAT
jgi:4-amino-4-deoxy-L-arabinose transferase-like glycosyltransferase